MKIVLLSNGDIVQMMGWRQSDVVFYKLTAQIVSAREVWQDSLEYYISLGFNESNSGCSMLVVGGDARKREECQADKKK